MHYDSSLYFFMAGMVGGVAGTKFYFFIATIA